MNNVTDPHIKSAGKLFSILDTVHQLGDASVSDVAAELGLAKSTTHDHLSALVEHEFLIKDGPEYKVSLKSLQYGWRARRRIALANVAKPTLDHLVEETDEIAWLVVEEYGHAVYIDKSTGPRAVQPYGEIGKRVPPHSIAAGKAIMAHLPEETVKEIITRIGLNTHTDNTITDPADLMEELENIRNQGYAQNDGEVIEGFRAVASPIIYQQEVQGSIVVSGPANRIRGDRFHQELPELLRGAANALELTLESA